MTALFILYLFLNSFLKGFPSVHAADMQPGTQASPPPVRSLFIPEKKEGADHATLNEIDKQNRKVESGDHSLKTLQSSLTFGSARAEQMVNVIQDEQFQKFMVQLTARGNQIMQDNQELKNPATIIAAAAVLWYGRTIRLIRSENFNLNSKLNANTKDAEFSMQSPLLNGALQYRNNSGMNLLVNRSISSIGSSAALRYNPGSNSLNTEINQRITPHINFTIGTESGTSGQPDNRAGVNYQLNF